ncbi:efflux RND transporter periplasmic adaptor subunit [Algoriphagus kandeliae]|uniref:Efflux RND transporter periplasmic adaptor subunit n=1 Tax=Algoriphagus kandeliae TaxID=2562278 RepID=A0A4Y9QNU2_9BACT|nr:efflux RND transporter periplasmic adaptor subunit [Algoriphagus kandeliae]TFV94311.1 efflux RND transporter periplasmic adaptor subunit [Algoriphagus kandeliae]
MKKFIPYIASLFVFSTMISCGNSSNEMEGIEVEEAVSSVEQIELSNAQFAALNMAWGNFEERNFSEHLSLLGMVRVPTEGRQEITAIYGGYVSDLKLIEGEQIRRGQVLFYLENPEFVRLQQEYLESKGQLDYLKAEYERQKTLYSEQISAQKNFLKAEAEYKTTQAKLAGLTKQLAMLSINVDALQPENIRSKIPVYSPINGFVETIDVVPGSYISETTRALTLLNRDHLHIELIAYEKDAAKIKVGQKVRISIPDLDVDEIVAEVYVISQSINEDRQVMIHAHILDEELEKSLVPGMYVESELDLEDRLVKVLPETAVVEVEDENFILIQQSKTDSGFVLEPIKVKVGISKDGFVEVVPLSELDPNAMILTKGAFSLM